MPRVSERMAAGADNALRQRDPAAAPDAGRFPSAQIARQCRVAQSCAAADARILRKRLTSCPVSMLTGHAVAHSPSVAHVSSAM